jgi:hypothetical protein
VAGAARPDFEKKPPTNRLRSVYGVLTALAVRNRTAALDSLDFSSPKTGSQIRL